MNPSTDGRSTNAAFVIRWNNKKARIPIAIGNNDGLKCFPGEW